MSIYSSCALFLLKKRGNKNMATGTKMLKCNESIRLMDIANLPGVLTDVDLYKGRLFMNVPEASTPQEAAMFPTTGICRPGVLSPDFAKALARAAMVMDGTACGAFGWNDDVSIGEWRCNNIFRKDAGDATVGELLSLAYVGNTGRFIGDQGGRSVDVAKVGYAPFLFALWGFFMEKCDGFKDAFDNYCVLSRDANYIVEARMAACRMAAIAYDALSRDVIAADLPTSANMYGAKTTKKLLDAIEESKKRPADRVLKALGWRNVGDHVARTLLGFYGGIIELFDCKEQVSQSVAGLPGIGQGIAQNIAEMLKDAEMKEQVRRLAEAGVNMAYIEKPIRTQDLSGEQLWPQSVPV